MYVFEKSFSSFLKKVANVVKVDRLETGKFGNGKIFHISKPFIFVMKRGAVLYSPSQIVFGQ